MNTEINISFTCDDSNTPTLPDAKRGDCSETHHLETKEQLDAGLVWWPCGFCGLEILIGMNTRETCKCGAKRHNHHGYLSWQKSDEICQYF